LTGAVFTAARPRGLNRTNHDESWERRGPGYDPELGRPIAAPLERCAELLGVDLATVRKLAADVEPYLRADGTKIWSLMQLERRLRPQAYRRRRGGYLDRRRTRTTDAEQLDDTGSNKDAGP
jgi:hypothetical protein